MLFNLLLSGQPFFNEELSHLVTRVSLELDDLAPLFVVDDRAVTIPELFEVPHQFLEVQVVGEALNDRQALSHRSLLELDVHHELLLGFLLLVVLSVVHSANSIESVLNPVSAHEFLLLVLIEGHVFLLSLLLRHLL